MDGNLTRAQHYRTLARQMGDTADGESDAWRREQLLDLQRQYSELAEKLVQAARKAGQTQTAPALTPVQSPPDPDRKRDAP